jgi:ribosomal protein S18
MIPHILETSFNIQYTAYKSLKKYCSENGKITFSEKIGYDMRKNINEE